MICKLAIKMLQHVHKSFVLLDTIDFQIVRHLCDEQIIYCKDDHRIFNGQTYPSFPIELILKIIIPCKDFHLIFRMLIAPPLSVMKTHYDSNEPQYFFFTRSLSICASMTMIICVFLNRIITVWTVSCMTLELIIVRNVSPVENVFKVISRMIKSFFVSVHAMSSRTSI